MTEEQAAEAPPAEQKEPEKTEKTESPQQPEQAEQPAEAAPTEETPEQPADNDLPKSFSVLPTVANPLIPRLVDLCLDTVINNFEQCTEIYRIPRKYHQKILRNIPETIPFPIAVMKIPDGIYWKRLMLSQFPNVPRNSASKTWKRFFLENYAQNKLENATEANIDEIFNDLRIIGPYIRKITLSRSPCKVSMFKLFRTFRGLKSLSLVYGEPRKSFAKYEDFENFDVREQHSATLRDCQQMSTDFQQLGKYCSLQEFTMSDNSLNDQAAVKVAEGLYKAFNSLTSLTFAHNEIHEKGAHAIGSILLHSPIKYLDLSDNQIGSSGAQKLCDCCKQSKTLEELNLSSNQIGDNGILFVALFLKATKSLKKLDISGNRIANFKDIIEALNVTKCLKELNISANPINEDDYDEIQRIVTNPNRRPDMVLDKIDMRRYDLTEEDFAIKTTETSEAPLLRFK